MPPETVSGPSPPQIRSLPPRPLIVSLPPRPTITSTPAVPFNVFAADVPTLVAGCPKHIGTAIAGAWGNSIAATTITGGARMHDSRLIVLTHLGRPGRAAHARDLPVRACSRRWRRSRWPPTAQ